VSQVNLLDGPVDRSLRKFALPLAVSFVVNLLYAWIDLYFVSTLGHNAVAALGISERIWFFTFAFGSGFAVGSGIIIARRIGEGRNHDAGQIALQSIIVMFLIGVVLAGLLHYNLNGILSILGIKGKVRELSTYYFIALVWGVPFNFLIFQVNAVIRSAGNSKYPMYVLLLSNLVNIILTPIFMFGIGILKPMGIFGAGLGTSISYLAASVYSVLLLVNKFKVLRIDLARFKFDLNIIKSVTKLGIPASLQLIAVSVTSMGLAANANMIGTEDLSTYIIGLRVDLLVLMSIFAFGAAIEIITGQNLGAGNIDRIFEYRKSAIKQLSIILICLGVPVLFFGEYLGMIFSDNSEVIKGVRLYLLFAVFGYIPFAIGIVNIRLISGAGDYFRSLYIVIAALVFFQLPFAYILSNILHSSVGIWTSMFISMFLFAIISNIQTMKKGWLKVKI